MNKTAQRNYKWTLLILTLLVSSLYLLVQVETIYGGDAGDLASAIIVGGIAHPPGYPLYTLLGVLITKVLFFGTYAWRIGFLSSVPAVFTVIIFFDLIYYLTRKLPVALFGGLVLTFVYPFWLYSVTVEVFSLNNLFLVSLLWFFIHWALEGKAKYLYFASLIFGLSFSHHHIILFMVPSFLYLYFQKRKDITAKIFIGSVSLFLLGLLPYFYILIKAYQNNSAINWMGPLSLQNFINLVTRAGYGTFRSGGFISHDPVLRLLDIWAYFDFAIRDFRIPGVLLFLSGFYYLAKAHKLVFVPLLLSFFSYLFFLFYASFPLVDNFMVATYERFLLPLYILTTVFITYGLIMVEKVLNKFTLRLIKNKNRQLVIRLLSICFFLYPLGLFLLNYPKLSILKQDFTAENFGRDILDSLPKNSIFIVSTDTPLFDTQYVYYSQKLWPDVKLIHLSKLFLPQDRENIKMIYPQLQLPDAKVDTKQIFRTFLLQNYDKFPIYSKLVLENSDGDWIPYGLVFRFIKKDDKPPADNDILAENEKLWSSYHVPNEGSLAKYQNLMLSDVIPSYAIAHQEIGFWAAKRKYSSVSEKHLLTAEKLYPADLDSYIILAQSYIVDKRCSDALNQINEVVKRNKDDPRIYFLESVNYAECFKDKEKSLFYQKLYEEKKHGKEIPLKML